MRPARAGTLSAAALILGLHAAPAMGDVFVLRGGDRITGDSVTEGKRTFKVKTPYGLLTIPRSKVDHIIRADGTEQPVNPESVGSLGSVGSAPVETVATLPRSRRARLVLIITGKTFWQAWDPKAGHHDPTLRFGVTLDEEVVATYVDAKTDPDIPGAMVNAFSFAAEDAVFMAGKDALVLPPEQRPGRIVLKIDVPVKEGTRLVRIAYQSNEGPAEDETAWRDLAAGSLGVELRAESPTFVRVNQERGRMEFSGFPRKRMKNVDTFALELNPETGEPPEPLTP
jgi:hypothetical protein